jgi:hypothetical protein
MIVAAAAAMLLAGCVTVAQNSLSPTEVQSFKLAGVSVGFAPEAGINWHDGYQAYAAAKAIPDHELASATSSPEAKSHVQGLLGARVKGAIESQMSGVLIGARPVRVDVTVRSFEISSAVQRILIGGGYGMTGDVTLVDAKTGATIVAYPNLVYVVPALQGVGGAIIQAAYDSGNPPAERIVTGFAEKYRDWLLKK